MKSNILLMMAAVMLSGTVASARIELPTSKVPNCFTAKNVVKGQFLVLLNEADTNKETVVEILAEIGLSVSDVIGDDILLVEVAGASVLKKSQQTQILKGLESLVQKQVVEAVSCNGLMKLL